VSGFSFRSVMAYSVLVRKGGWGGFQCVFVVRPKSSDLRCREYWIPGSDGYNDRYLIRSNPPPPPSEVQSLVDRIFCNVSGWELGGPYFTYLPTYLAGGTTWGTHENLGEHHNQPLRTWGNIITNYWELGEHHKQLLRTLWEHHNQLFRTLWEHDGNHFLGCATFLGGTSLVGTMGYPTLGRAGCTNRSNRS